jgi:hypothetical protein
MRQDGLVMGLEFAHPGSPRVLQYKAGLLLELLQERLAGWAEASDPPCPVASNARGA